MLDTFKAQLKAKAKTLGVTNLSNKRIDAYAATLEKQNPNLATDDDHSEKVDAFLELIDIKEIAAYDDYKVSKGKPTSKTEPTKKDPEEGKTEPVTTQEPQDANTKLLQEMATRLAALESEKAQSSIKSKITGHEKLKNVPADYYEEWALPQKEEDIDAFADKVLQKHTAYEQSFINQGLKKVTKPGVASGGGKEKADPSVVAYAQKQNATVKPAATTT